MPKLTATELKKLVRGANIENELLQESSYNRIRGHVENGNAFAIVTSDRHERSGKENKSRAKLL